MKILLAVSLWLVALGSFSSPTFAQCQSLFQGRFDWARHSVNGTDLFDRSVGFKLTSNRADGRYVSYADGTLKGRRDDRNNLSLADNDDVKQLFSDRRYTGYDVNGCRNLTSIVLQPFPVTHSDRLGIEIMPNPFDSATVTVTMTLRSWGNGRETFTGQCRDNMIFGFVDSSQTIFTLSLFNSNP
jgi:hypothetical protein